MILFYLILLILTNLFLLGFVVWMWSDRDYWRGKYKEQLETLYPIVWDYTKERGWIDDNSGS